MGCCWLLWFNSVDLVFFIFYFLVVFIGRVLVCCVKFGFGLLFWFAGLVGSMVVVVIVDVARELLLFVF